MFSLKNQIIFLIISLNFLFTINLVNSNPAVGIMYDELINNEDKMLLRIADDIIDSIESDDYDDDTIEIGNDEAIPTTSTIKDINSYDNNNNINTNNALKSHERCLLPVRKGVCRALIPRWSYDPINKICQEFKFGGCDGNGNNFISHKQCMDTCNGLTNV